MNNSQRKAMFAKKGWSQFGDWGWKSSNPRFRKGKNSINAEEAFVSKGNDNWWVTHWNGKGATIIKTTKSKTDAIKFMKSYMQEN